MNLESHESADDRQFADYHTDRNGHSIAPEPLSASPVLNELVESINIEPKKRISYKSELKEMTKQRDKWRYRFFGVSFFFAVEIVLQLIYG